MRAAVYVCLYVCIELVFRQGKIKNKRIKMNERINKTSGVTSVRTEWVITRCRVLLACKWEMKSVFFLKYILTLHISSVWCFIPCFQFMRIVFLAMVRATSSILIITYLINKSVYLYLKSNSFPEFWQSASRPLHHYFTSHVSVIGQNSLTFWHNFNQKHWIC